MSLHECAFCGDETHGAARVLADGVYVCTTHPETEDRRERRPCPRCGFQGLKKIGRYLTFRDGEVLVVERLSNHLCAACTLDDIAEDHGQRYLKFKNRAVEARRRQRIRTLSEKDKDPHAG